MQCGPDYVCDLSRAGQDVVVPETEEAEAAANKFGIPHQITVTLDILGAVGFDYQLGLVAYKVGDVGPYGNLTAEFESHKATIAQQHP